MIQLCSEDQSFILLIWSISQLKFWYLIQEAVSLHDMVPYLFKRMWLSFNRSSSPSSGFRCLIDFIHARASACMKEVPGCSPCHSSNISDQKQAYSQFLKSAWETDPISEMRGFIWNRLRAGEANLGKTRWLAESYRGLETWMMTEKYMGECKRFNLRVQRKQEWMRWKRFW